LLLPASSVAAVAVSVNGPYVPASPHPGVHVITPVPVSSEAPLGSAGLTLQVSGPAAQAPSVADGVMVRRLVSTTGCGSAIAATVTVPTRCLTPMETALRPPASSVAAVAVSVNGP